MVRGGGTRANSSITFAPSSRSFYDGRYVHARTRKIVMARGEGILRSIHVTITLNSVYPLVHRRAGTLAKPARARRAPFHTTIDHFAFADYRDPETIIRRSFHASTRLRSHRCHLTRCARRTHLLEPENSSREDYASLVAFSIIFIYTLSKIIRVVAASIEHFLFLWLRHSLLITRPGLSFSLFDSSHGNPFAISQTADSTWLTSFLHHVTRRPGDPSNDPSCQNPTTGKQTLSSISLRWLCQLDEIPNNPPDDQITFGKFCIAIEVAIIADRR